MFKRIVSIICLSLAISCSAYSKDLPKNSYCIITGNLVSMCYIRGWAGKEVEYVDEFTDSVVAGLKGQGYDIDDEDAELFLNNCGTFFNAGRADDRVGVSYRQAKANESILKQTIPGRMCGANN